MMSKSTLDYSNELCYSAFDISERCEKFMGYDTLYDQTGSTINVISNTKIHVFGQDTPGIVL